MSVLKIRRKKTDDNYCSDKKDEASAETSSDDDSDDDDEEEDLIGEKGKAPNTLLMEVLNYNSLVFFFI